MAGEQLSLDEATRYRAVVARGHYLSADRPDIAFAAKEAAREMATPTRQSWELVRRIASYLVGKPKLRWWFGCQEFPGDLVGLSDSDWAGCRGTRKSTSGGAIRYGSHLPKSWSRTQDTISPSSAEAELHAGVKCSAEVLGMASCYKELGLDLCAQVWGDVSAAIGIIQRHGLGKTLHISISMLWVQQKRSRKEIACDEVPGTVNIADRLAEHVPRETLDTHIETMGLG